MKDGVQKAAERLREAAQARTPCAPVRDLIGPGDVEAAYAVQEIGTRSRLAAGARVSGRKIIKPRLQRSLPAQVGANARQRLSRTAFASH